MFLCLCVSCVCVRVCVSVCVFVVIGVIEHFGLFVGVTVFLCLCSSLYVNFCSCVCVCSCVCLCSFVCFCVFV